MLRGDTAAGLENCPSLGRMLERSGRLHRGRNAVYAGKAALKYRALNTSANAWAHALRDKLGVTAKDRVAILLENDVPYLYALFGALKAGAAVVPLNTFLAAPELEYIIADSGAKVLVSSDRFASLARRFSEKIPSLKSLVTVGREDLGGDTWLSEELVSGEKSRDPEQTARRDDLAMIVYTSGTTGHPKGAMLTHGNLLSNAAASAMAVRIGKRDRVLLMLPMFHSFTLTACIIMPIAAGAGIVVVDKLRSIGGIIKSLLTKRVTMLIGIPQIYDVIAETGLPLWVRMLLKLRLCVSGSAPLPEKTLSRFEKIMRVPLLEGYGLSEASPVVSINPIDGARKPGSVGKSLQGVSVRIVSEKGRELPPGGVGEIAVRGPNVMKGYLNLPSETKETIRNGWLMTGDIGKMDGEGYIYILDRKKDMILFHGMNVYPREIEEALYGHPSVAEAAVVGKADKRRGEIPVAFVSAREGADADAAALIRHCRARLAAYKIPHRIIFRDKLPRTATGKISKRELKKQLAQVDT